MAGQQGHLEKCQFDPHKPLDPWPGLERRPREFEIHVFAFIEPLETIAHFVTAQDQLISTCA